MAVPDCALAVLHLLVDLMLTGALVFRLFCRHLCPCAPVACPLLAFGVQVPIMQLRVAGLLLTVCCWLLPCRAGPCTWLLQASGAPLALLPPAPLLPSPPHTATPLFSPPGPPFPAWWDEAYWGWGFLGRSRDVVCSTLHPRKIA